MPTIQAIQTRYAGCHFRSRLEARWAVFFDHLGISWEHEPEGYETTVGPYLPDFRLHLNTPTLFEVKPPIRVEGRDEQHAVDIVKWCDAAMAIDGQLIVARGMPRPSDPSGQDDPNWTGSYGGYMEWYAGYGIDGMSSDGPYAFCICPWCPKVGITFDGRGARVCGGAAHPDQAGREFRHPLTGELIRYYDDKSYSYDHPRIVAAYTAARSARFEHGEQP